ncbi:hypothetical protein IFM89_025918 [Coptis chinensis]|uniref:DUF4283 domain-containing protein n=1 Tax=Coptis chinensis TaxID=261450 RepID=A0A835HH51_9MAGN|nr:hypothetical protein IFM89_025918 [Coptis chinensis]
MASLAVMNPPLVVTPDGSFPDRVGANNSRSWSDLSNQNKSASFDQGLEKFYPEPINGITAVPSSILEEGLFIWNNYPVGYFVEKRFPYPVVKNILEKQWKPKGQVFVVRPWSEDVHLLKQGNKSVPIWAKLDLPKQLWTKKGIGFVISMIGNSLCVDEGKGMIVDGKLVPLDLMKVSLLSIPNTKIVSPADSLAIAELTDVNPFMVLQYDHKSDTAVVDYVTREPSLPIMVKAIQAVGVTDIATLEPAHVVQR